MSVKTYNDFLLEWGYGGEGGAASKDPITVKDGMLDEIDLREHEKDDDDNDIVILKHFLDIDNMGVEESVVNELDPYGEDNWSETTYDYKNWKGSVIDFLLQLNEPVINTYLYRCINSKKITDLKFNLEDLVGTLLYIKNLDFEDNIMIQENLFKYFKNKIK